MKLGESLVNAGLLTREQLKLSLDEQQKTNERLGDISLRKGFVNTRDLATVLAEHFNVPFLDLKAVYKEISADLIDRVQYDIAKRFKILPVELKNNSTLVVAMFDPLDFFAIDTLRIKCGLKIQCVVAAEEDILEAIEYCYHQMPRMKQHIENFIDLESANGNIAEEVANLDDGAAFSSDDLPVVQYVRSLIIQAANSGASDIHLQPKQDSVELRLRVDGVMHPIEPPPLSMLPAITTRIKIIAGLDIAERRLPQDGRFRVTLGKSDIDIRTSSFPTIYGESMVMRLLDTSAPLVGLEQLGLNEEDQKHWREVIVKPYGLILVTGPTGSGKTTTLYTTLNEIKSADKNIVTLEDPVEYRLPFIQQSQMNPQIGLDFARGLRSILRQDPDIIMVGEIRDKETAEIAIHAALTGHLVFSTLHTNDAAGAAVRLINMGIEPFLITSSLLGVVAQRLVRTVCPHCKEEAIVDGRTLKEFGIPPGDFKIARGKGCSKCLNSGYRGRRGIFELMLPDDNLRQLILQGKSSEEIRSAAQKAGMKTLRQSGIEKMKEGLTTPEELFRLTQEAEG